MSPSGSPSGRFARLDLRARAGDAAAFAGYAWRRFWDDRCLRVAASLSYTTLLALVPLMAIGFAMFSAFPVFDQAQERVQAFIINNLVPELGEAVHEQLTGFVANAGRLTAVGIIVLAVTALMMFATVETAFNAIWRVGESRPVATRLLVFWAILTLGPLLLGASFTLSSYIFAQTRLHELEAFTGPLGRLFRLLPFGLEIALFSVLYTILPNRVVAWRHAIAGGVVAALLFELLKKGFAYYIANFPAQETIYGALSAIPLFLVWMYLAWSVVLIGAEIVASLPEYRLAPADRLGTGMPRRERLTLSLAVLAALANSARAGGGGLTVHELRDAITAEELRLDQVLRRLGEAKYIAATGDEKWLLARDLDHTSLHDLFRDLGLDVMLEEVGDGEPPPWRERVAALISSANEAQRDIMHRPLGELLDGAAAAPADAPGPADLLRPGGETTELRKDRRG